LEIAAVGVHVIDLETIGESDEGYECPRDPQAVAWYSSGTLPGESGLALMIASAQGVFQRLPELGPEDPIVVVRADGTRPTFKKSDPTSAAPGARPARLQLTACGGQAPVNVYADLVP
jgi:hypothetical protein